MQYLIETARIDGAIEPNQQGLGIGLGDSGADGLTGRSECALDQAQENFGLAALFATLFALGDVSVDKGIHQRFSGEGLFKQGARLLLIKAPRALDKVAQQGFENGQRGLITADLGDQLEPFQEALAGLVVIDVAQRELDQSGQHITLDDGAAPGRDFV